MALHITHRYAPDCEPGVPPSLWLTRRPRYRSTMYFRPVRAGFGINRMAHSPPTFRRKKLTSIRPFVPMTDQTSADRVVQHIFALGFGAFETTNPVMKRSILP